MSARRVVLGFGTIVISSAIGSTIAFVASHLSRECDHLWALYSVPVDGNLFGGMKCGICGTTWRNDELKKLFHRRRTIFGLRWV